MNQLIQVNYDSEQPTVLGRELHEFLEINTRYNDWFQRMVEYGFEETTDFYSILSKSTIGRPTTDHQLTIPMAKEIAMIQRNEKGKQARQYFIQIETYWNSPEAIMQRALTIANKRMNELQRELLDVQPKVLFAESVTASTDSILIGDLAKLLKQNGYDTGQKRLFEKLRNDGFLMKFGLSRNMPTQKSMNLGLMEITEHIIRISSGEERIRRTTKVTGKGQFYFINYFLNGN